MQGKGRGYSALPVYRRNGKSFSWTWCALQGPRELERSVIRRKPPCTQERGGFYLPLAILGNFRSTITDNVIQR